MMNISPVSPVIALVDSGLSGESATIKLIDQIDFTRDGDSHPHGAQMAEIVADLVAPLSVVSLRILDGAGHLDGPETLDAALDWLLHNHQRLAIRVALITVATATHHQDDAAFRDQPTTRMIRQLVREGVFIICPAGNAFSRFFRTIGPEGMAWPAILRETISVGATTWRFDHEQWQERIAPHSQRLMATAIHPGTTIFALDPMADPTILPGPLSDKARTSGAAAYVSGLVLKKLSESPDITHEEMVVYLRKGARMLPPARPALRGTGISYPALTT